MSLIGMAKYLYEIGTLKLTKRSGWWRMGVQNPESVAEHSYRTAIIGYTLACLEGADPEKTASMCLFHDTAESRTTDLHWVAKRYISVKEGEKQAIKEQLAQLPETVTNRILKLLDEYENKTTLEAQIAKEADLLECLLQSREYQMRGYSKGLEWAQICRDGLKNKTSRKLAESCLEEDPGDWFKNIQDNPRLDLGPVAENR